MQQHSFSDCKHLIKLLQMYFKKQQGTVVSLKKALSHGHFPLQTTSLYPTCTLWFAFINQTEQCISVKRAKYCLLKGSQL